MLYPDKYCTALHKYVCLLLALITVLFILTEVLFIDGEKKDVEVIYKNYFPTASQSGGTEYKITTELGQFGISRDFYHSVSEGNTIKVTTSYFLNKPKVFKYSSSNRLFREYPMVFYHPFFLVLIGLLLVIVLASLFKKGDKISNYFEDYYAILTVSLFALLFFFITVYA